MVPLSTAAFEHLSNRPPTPPKDHESDLEEALRFLDVDYTLDSPEKEKEVILAAADTLAQSSPPSSFESGTNTRSAKRVEFSPCVTAHKPNISEEGRASPLFRRLHSRKQLRPLKSILKSTLGQQTPTPDSIGSPASDYFSLDKPKPFAVMLESVVKLLAAPSPALRLDGYRTLNGALKAYEELPDVDALKTKMTLLTQFMARDITNTTREKVPMDATLTTQALKLVTVFLLTPALSHTLPEDFEVLLVDRSIEVLTQETVSKTVANHHMYLLASQSFSSRVVTPAKAEQLVAALLTIHNRVTGNSVIASRLVIFQRLLEQAPAVMLATIRDWLTHVFHGTLSSIKDIRGRAIDTGLLAASVLGINYQATKAIIDLFNTSTNDTSTYGDYFTARLSDMIGQKELCADVPQIWSLVVVFFKSKKRRLVQWPLFKKAWLLIIQRCLNSNDVQTKYRATLAWGRLVYVVSPDKETAISMESIVPMLRVPFVVAFDKKGRDQSTKQARQMALAGYCNLLHYALRPTQTHEELDFYWDEYVHTVLSKLLRAGGKDAHLASRVLKGLFGRTSNVWNENVANEGINLTPTDLPRLDPKWVRLRTRKILELMAPFLASSLSTQSEVNGIETSPWKEFVGAIAEAGSQEVRGSMELREALAHLMNFFRNAWTEASKVLKAPTNGVWIIQFGTLLHSAIETLGPVYFAEASLTRNSTSSFEAAPTPSHRPSKHHAVLQSPVVFLYGLFSQPPCNVETDSDYFDTAKDILQQVCQAKATRTSRLHLLRQCAEVVVSGATQASLTDTHARLWSIVAQEATQTMVDPDLDDTTQDPLRLGHQMRDIVHIMTLGLGLSNVDMISLPANFELYGAAATTLRSEAGEGGVVLGLMEPIAEALLQKQKVIAQRTFAEFTIKLLRAGVWPRTRQQMDEGRRALSNHSLMQTKHPALDPFTHVYSLITKATSEVCQDDSQRKTHLAALAGAIQGFVMKCPLSQASVSLRKMQDGLATLVRDRPLPTHDTLSRSSAGSAEILSLWQSILGLLRPLPSNTLLLRGLDTLFAAGFSSSHRAIINTSATFWNETFGQLDALDYPPTVEIAIRRLRPLVDLDLPTFPKNGSDREPSPLRDFMDSQDDKVVDEAATPAKTSVRTRGIIKPLLQMPATNRERFTPSKVDRTRPSPITRGRTSHSASKAKLRHDDSQVQFIAVESSSPISEEVDSQLLTEHQREVNQRQHFETAKQYPHFLSSPAPGSASKSGMPRLDFSQVKSVQEDHITPMLGNDDVDDYLTSSPTPKATHITQPLHDLSQNVWTDSEEHLLHPEINPSDIPSSPPQISEDEALEYQAETDIDNRNIEMNGPKGDQIQHETHSLAAVTEAQSSKPTDSEEKQANLQNGDLQAEETGKEDLVHVPEPAAQSKDDDHPTALSSAPPQVLDSDVYVDATTEIEVDDGEQEDRRDRSASSSPLQFTDSLSEMVPLDTTLDISHIASVEKQDDLRDEDEGVDTSRVEESYPALNLEDAMQSDATPADKKAFSTPVPETEIPQSEKQSLDTSKKRKRASETVYATPSKRRKQKSPLKRVLSFLTGSQAEDEEEQMEDCIVVASQPEPTIALTEETPKTASSLPASIEGTKVRRGRGRPRKSQTPVPTSPAQVPETRQLKRNFSLTSNDSPHNHEQAMGGESAEMQTSYKARRVTRSQDVKAAQVEAAIEVPRSARRTLQAVVIPISEPRETQVESKDEVDDNAESQLRTEQEAAPQRNRRIAKPKSILERLKAILADCKSMVLGSQEEFREFDNVLFEVRSEVNAAERRGRDG